MLTVFFSYSHEDEQLRNQLEQQLTPEIASRNLRHFLNVLNKRVYGKAAQRFGKCLRVFPVLEGGGGKRL